MPIIEAYEEDFLTLLKEIAENISKLKDFAKSENESAVALNIKRVSCRARLEER